MLATPSKHNGEERQQRVHWERPGVALAGHYPFPHQVTCKDAEGQPQTYKSKDCLSAAKKMSAYHLTEVTCSTCKLSIAIWYLSKAVLSGLLIYTSPADRLRHMTVEILKACASNKSINATYSAEESRGNKGVQIVFTLLRRQGHIGAAWVIGGVDPTGPHLFTVAPHGSTDKLPYVTMGSGSLAAMAVFETKWKPKMACQEAIDLIVQAIYA
ncbi:proteasome core particle subunit beta 2 [Puccinia graminis f. sp. tritici]|uniref:Proteasome core particle subunit beta 2 n=1 Tax=Puccinia graminis f. sp. tritici TaxID=56615 RepID=A0A5B0LKJ0_PUCGR|nr:proteasome core particle subunit beta 2 [Puccinia graminis f. sp. tritici]